MQFWITLWTIIWYAGLTVFSLLSLLIIVFGAGDLVSLLNSLRARHTEAEALVEAMHQENDA